jgi:uncharacterized protein (DUF952 family)
MALSEAREVVRSDQLSISEVFGRVASREEALSACIATVRGPAQDAWQTAQFDSRVLVLAGRAELHFADGRPPLVATAGGGVLVPRGLKARWVWPADCTYVPICTPAYDPEAALREDAGGAPPAKDPAAFLRLRVLHEELRRPWIYHCAPRALWEVALASGAPAYYPPTYEQDGFVHATSDAGQLLSVLNHFYKAEPGEWVCVRMSRASLAAHGVDVVFEAAAPVGDTPVSAASDVLFPHVLGGIPLARPSAALEVTPIVRARDGTFLAVAGATDTDGPRAPVSAARERALLLLVGAACGAALAAGALRRR